MWLSSGCFLYTLKIAKIVSGMRFLCDFVVMTADISTIFWFFFIVKRISADVIRTTTNHR